MSARGVESWLVELATATAAEVLVTDRVQEVAAGHHALMVRWNRVHNLTRVVEPEAVARLHWLDCLLAAASLEAHAGRPDRVLDVGAGAGFPGVCLASAWPESEVTCLEPARKRVSFLQRVRAERKLENLIVREGRLEDVPPDQTWTAVTSRATFQPDAVSRLAGPVGPGGWVGALVGVVSDDRWAEDATRAGLQEPSTLRYELPGVEHRAVLFARRH